MIPGPLQKYVAYSTKLGAQLVGDSRALLRSLEPESVDLIVTSPPFPLLREKEYGNKEQHEYVEWLMEFGAAALPALKQTGSFVIDLGGTYQRGVPVRSLYQWRVLLGFCDTLGYRLAEEFYWHNPAKLPSPIEWVNKRKIRVKDSVNVVWWLSKGEWPKADVKRVLAPYSERMKKLIKDPDAFYKPKGRPSGHDIAKNPNAQKPEIQNTVAAIEKGESISFAHISSLPAKAAAPALTNEAPMRRDFPPDRRTSPQLDLPSGQ